MLPRTLAAVLASEASPAALEKYSRVSILGLQYPEPDDEDECDHSWPLSVRFQKLAILSWIISL